MKIENINPKIKDFFEKNDNKFEFLDTKEELLVISKENEEIEEKKETYHSR